MSRSCWVLVFVSALGCSNERPPGASTATTGSAATPSSPRSQADQCRAVRDHVVQLISDYYLAHAPESFDALDRSDPSVTDGLPPETTRETFGAFLSSSPGKAWLERARARTIASAAMASTVDRCVQDASQTHLACWLGATSMEQFQACPIP